MAQMALAAGLLWQSHQFIEFSRPSPARILLVCIDGPALALVEALFYPLGYGYWMFLGYGFPGLDAIFVACAGMFWYWVALNISSRRERNTLLLFKWTPLRISADLLLMAFGPFFLLHFRYLDIADMRWPWFVPALTFFAIWAFGPLFVFGYDLFRSARTSFGQRKVNRTE